ncbi:hypothetical protein ABPG72_002715 [Tetrahymena utriculariae]
MDQQLKRQQIITFINELYEEFIAIRSNLFEVAEIPHLSCCSDSSEFNIYYDFYHLEKSLKYMKKNINSQVYKQVSQDSQILICQLKDTLKAINIIQQRLNLLDEDYDQQIKQKYHLMENYFDYKSAENTRSKINID